MTTAKRSAANRIALIVLGVAIVMVLVLFLASLSTCGSSSSTGSSGTSLSTASQTHDDQGRITLGGIYGLTGPELIDALSGHGYSFQKSENYWRKDTSDSTFEVVIIDARGSYLTKQELSAVTEPVDKGYEIGLYSGTPKNRDYGITNQGVDVDRYQTFSGSDRDAAVAVLNGTDGPHLVVVDHMRSSAGHEYMVYSASEQMIEEQGVSDLSARTLDRAYQEVVENYS